MSKARNLLLEGDAAGIELLGVFRWEADEPGVRAVGYFGFGDRLVADALSENRTRFWGRFSEELTTKRN
jgi:hypothetical protein